MYKGKKRTGACSGRTQALRGTKVKRNVSSRCDVGRQLLLSIRRQRQICIRIIHAITRHHTPSHAITRHHTPSPVFYAHLRAHESREELVCCVQLDIKKELCHV